MHEMVHTIQQIARHEAQQHPNAALAVVKSVHGTNGAKEYACTVALRETGIVLPHVPIATGLIGLTALPRVGDLVVLVFAGGDLHAPIVVGRLYNESVEPPAHGPGELVVVLPGDETAPEKRLELRIMTPGDGTRALGLTLAGDVKIELEADDTGVRIQAQDARVTVRQTGGADGQVEIKVGNSKVLVEQGGDVTIEAEGTLTLKANQIKISGDSQVKITGQTIDLN